MENGQETKKILIISNSCFSKTDSNGRTLSNLFQCFAKDSLAQFFVYGTPGLDMCNNYYRVTNQDALKSCLKQKEFGERVYSRENLENITTSQNNNKRIKKTPLNMLFRELIWKMGRWNGQRLKKWIDDFSPNAIFICVGNNCFLIRLAIKMAKERNIPIFLYSTENYQFKNYNYLTKRFSLFYLLFYKKMKKWNKKLHRYVKKGFFNTPLLAEE